MITDAINFSLAVDNFVAGELENLAPHKNVFDLSTPFNVSRSLSMPKPVVATISCWLSNKEEVKIVDNKKQAEMARLFC